MSVISGITIPIVLVLLVLSPLAIGFIVKLSFSIAASMFLRFLDFISYPFKNLDTVPTATPASFATSFMVEILSSPLF